MFEFIFVAFGRIGAVEKLSPVKIPRGKSVIQTIAIISRLQLFFKFSRRRESVSPDSLIFIAMRLIIRAPLDVTIIKNALFSINISEER